MGDLDRAALKSEIVAELIAHLSQRPEILETLDHAPWRTTGMHAEGNRTDGTLPAWVTAKIHSLDRAIRELGQWRAQVESHMFASGADGISEPTAVEDHAVAIELPMPDKVPSVPSPIPPSASDEQLSAAVTLAAQTPLPPAASIAVPRPVITPVTDKSPAEAKPKASETEGPLHPHISLLVEKAPLQAIGLDP